MKNLDQAAELAPKLYLAHQHGLGHSKIVAFEDLDSELQAAWICVAQRSMDETAKARAAESLDGTRLEALRRVMPPAVELCFEFFRTDIRRHDDLEITHFTYTAQRFGDDNNAAPGATIGITDDVPLSREGLTKVVRETLTRDMIRAVSAGLARR